eukprot:164985-Chlamydomonas_euryale.AAC.1
MHAHTHARTRTHTHTHAPAAQVREALGHDGIVWVGAERNALDDRERTQDEREERGDLQRVAVAEVVQIVGHFVNVDLGGAAAARQLHHDLAQRLHETRLRHVHLGRDEAEDLRGVEVWRYGTGHAGRAPRAGLQSLPKAPVCPARCMCV